MSYPPVVRAAYTNLFIDQFREIGVPVERRLADSLLPGWIEEIPDAYVNFPLALQWVADCSRDLELMELGFLAASRVTLETFAPDVQRVLREVPTCYARIEALLKLARSEDSTLVTCIAPEGEHVRVTCDTIGLPNVPALCLPEWLNLIGVVSVVQSVAGPGWQPSEITFVSACPPPPQACEHFGNKRMLVGQPHSSILIDARTLAPRCPDWPTAQGSGSDVQNIEDWSFISALRSTLQPYLAEGYPDLAKMAEVVGLSPRTLQRRLRQSGCTYSDVVQNVRLEAARDMLADPDLKIIDVAMMSGYENPQHFSRAFRRLTGLAPRDYRRQTGRQ